MIYPSLNACRRDIADRRASAKLVMSEHRFKLVSGELLTREAGERIASRCFPKLTHPGDAEFRSLSIEAGAIVDAYQPVTLDDEVAALEERLILNPDYATTIRAALQAVKEYDLRLRQRHEAGVRPRELVMDAGRWVLREWAKRFGGDAKAWIAEFEARAAEVKNEKMHLRSLGCRTDQA